MGAATATGGSTEYFGTAQKRIDVVPSHLCLDLLYCFVPPHQIILQSQHGMEVKANVILLCSYQYMIEYEPVWM